MRAEGEWKNMWASIRIGKEDFWLVNPPEKREKKPEVAYSGFVVKDIKAEVGALKKRRAKFEKAEKSGMTTRVDGPIAYDAGGANAFLKDTEGNLLMLFRM